MLNSTGRWTGWGTTTEEVWLVMNDVSHLCLQYQWCLYIYYIYVMRCMIIEWSIMSNAEERSSSARIMSFLLSILVRISLDIFFGRCEGFCAILKKKLIISLRLVLKFSKISTGLILGDNCWGSEGQCLVS